MKVAAPITRQEQADAAVDQRLGRPAGVVGDAVLGVGRLLAASGRGGRSAAGRASGRPAACVIHARQRTCSVSREQHDADADRGHGGDDQAEHHRSREQAWRRPWPPARRRTSGSSGSAPPSRAMLRLRHAISASVISQARRAPSPRQKPPARRANAMITRRSSARAGPSGSAGLALGIWRSRSSMKDKGIGVPVAKLAIVTPAVTIARRLSARISPRGKALAIHRGTGNSLNGQ